MAGVAPLATLPTDTFLRGGYQRARHYSKGMSPYLRSTTTGEGIIRGESKGCARRHVNAPGPHSLRWYARVRAHVFTLP